MRGLMTVERDSGEPEICGDNCWAMSRWRLAAAVLLAALTGGAALTLSGCGGGQAEGPGPELIADPAPSGWRCRKRAWEPVSSTAASLT